MPARNPPPPEGWRAEFDAWFAAARQPGGELWEPDVTWPLSDTEAQADIINATGA